MSAKTKAPAAPLLRVENLVVQFPGQGGPNRVVDDVSFEIRPGRVLGIVGESGSGKTVTSRAVMRMIKEPGEIVSGRILLGDEDLVDASDERMREVRGRNIAMIFQDPQATLNPVVRIGRQIAEALRIHGVDNREAEARTLELLTQVGIPDPRTAVQKYPHEFSGGMRQRVVIAIALANKPALLIADEPTTALDVTIQAQILQLLKDLRDQLGIAILFITHDMGVVAEMCDDVVVMYRGKVVETGAVRRVLDTPVDPYTRSLMDAVPKMDDPLRPSPEQLPPVLDVRDVRTDLGSRRRLFGRSAPFFAVDGVSLHVAPGETLGLVGESGCGKSTLSRTIVGIVKPVSGQVRIDGKDVTFSSLADRRSIARKIQYVFQDPFSSLNPRRTAGQSIEEALSVAGVPAAARRGRAAELLERVGLGEAYHDRYPYAFSGGQRQRVGIARALAARPRILILDEPVSALDVSIQAQVLDLLSGLQSEFGLGYLFISHDLSVVRGISHRVAVMYKGRIVEEGTTEQIFGDPQHEYTRTLLASTPRLEVGSR